jgi:hypothetical protein
VTPDIAFPAETKSTTSTSTKVLTRAQKLAKALATCHKEKKHSSKRAACEKQAHRTYAAVRKRSRA